MKVFVTGSKKTGKSTCIQAVCRQCSLSCCGYLTLPYYENEQRIGFYLHSYVDLGRNDILFSRDKETVSGVFNDFGVQILEHSNKGVLILDEIGFLERNESKYVNVLLNKIKSYPNIIGALRKSDIPYIQEIKSMPDVIVYDLDTMDFKEVYNQIYELFKR